MGVRYYVWYTYLESEGEMSDVWYFPELDTIFFVTYLYNRVHDSRMWYLRLYGAHLDFGPGYESLLVFDDRWKNKCVYLGEL
jgi:hypothetical protein